MVERFADASVRKSIETDLKLLEHYDELITDLELYIVRTAKLHDADTFHRLRSIPGVGKILAMTILYEVHDIDRFPRVQEFCSYGRLVKCSRESAGKHQGFGGQKIGNVHLKWAFSEAAVLFLRKNEAAKLYRARLVKRHGKAKSLTILAHKIARAVFFILKRRTVFQPETFFA